MLAAAIAAGLTAVGRDVIDADVAATPTTGVLVRSSRPPAASRFRPATIRPNTTA